MLRIVRGRLPTLAHISSWHQILRSKLYLEFVRAPPKALECRVTHAGRLSRRKTRLIKNQ